MTLDTIRAVRVWTRSLAAWSIAAEQAFALSLAWVLHRQELFDPAFLSDANGGWQAPQFSYTLAAMKVLAASAGEVVKRFREARD
ncbi:hypothetical protein ACFVT1_26305 [Streptomyces sp. NPDC057963]|uniref:hypothetical protein n=1 Tax=Streptomyces sp. NPDC057963 TaxID=3346290 RepID=UPI0036EC6EB9